MNALQEKLRPILLQFGRFLVVGGISAVIALAGPSAAILFLACIGLIGAWRARALPEVSHGK